MILCHFCLNNRMRDANREVTFTGERYARCSDCDEQRHCANFPDSRIPTPSPDFKYLKTVGDILAAQDLGNGHKLVFQLAGIHADPTYPLSQPASYLRTASVRAIVRNSRGDIVVRGPVVPGLEYEKTSRAAASELLSNMIPTFAHPSGVGAGGFSSASPSAAYQASKNAGISDEFEDVELDEEEEEEEEEETDEDED